MKRIVSMVGLGLLFALAVAAQTKIAGKMQCPEPEVVGTVDAGTRPDKVDIGEKYLHVVDSNGNGG